MPCSPLAIILAIIYVPVLDPIFETAPLVWQDWLLMLPLIAAQGITAELTKPFLRMPRFQGWLHPYAAPSMLETEYANPGSEERVVTSG